MFTASGGPDGHKRSGMPSALWRRKIETLFVLWSDSSDAALCESGLTILIITRFLLPPRNEERIVLLLSANRPLLGIVARGRRAEIRAGIGGKVGDVSGGDNLQSAK